MDLEQYLEKDILMFLDGKMDKKEVPKRDREEEYGLYNTKDYLKELNRALETDELSKAKRLFDELKESYGRIPKTNPDRKKIYAILEKMYEKIQEYVEIKEGKIEVIKEGDSEIFKDKNSKYVKQQPAKVVVNNIVNRFETINTKAIPFKYYGDKTKKADQSLSSTIANMDNGIIQPQTTAPKEDAKTAHGPAFPASTQPADEQEIQMGRVAAMQSIPERIVYVNRDYGMDSDEDTSDTRLNNITNRLLTDLRKKFNADENEQNRKIDALRKEIMTKVTQEVYKVFEDEKAELNARIEDLKKQLYGESSQIISNSELKAEAALKDRKYLEEPRVSYPEDHGLVSDDSLSMGLHLDDDESGEDEDSISREERDRFVTRDDIMKIESDIEELKGADGSTHYMHSPFGKPKKYSSKDLKIVYEQAIYKMFDSKYEEAATLFRKIIEHQPKNKAAMIRLQECMEKSPEAAQANSATDEQIYAAINPSQEEGPAPEFKMDNVIESFDDNKALKKHHDHPISHSRAELQKMYEQGIYVMFQSNYEEAAGIFKDILRIRPENKAAKIRLQECMEAINGA